jgi:hypothetical protein
VFSNETENNASVKQEMTTNINVKLRGDNNKAACAQPPAYPGDANPNVAYPPVGIYPNEPNVNFCQGPPLSPRIGPEPGNTMMTPGTSAYPFPANNQVHERAIDLEAEENKDAKIKVLEALLEAYEGVPIVIKGCLTLHHTKLIEIIRILTNADKVEIMTEDGEGCGCGSSKYAIINKIFIIGVNGKRG